ncbi:GNAT family N-acetyltransferase [Salinicola sp. V024]|uniref:GNAT family N-acetyltransferase n=1 Tax=Salinicola sp. V024 TaxID=3459609 RepID=UPI004044E437
MAAMQIVDADSHHLSAITDIFNHYILHTNARFETSPLTLVDRREWFSLFARNSRYQLLVAVEGGQVEGFAGSQPYRKTSAFCQTVETTIYLAPDRARRGIGTRLYSALFSRLSEQELNLAVAGIALPNESSIALHEKFGFRRVGIFEDYAIKNGQYLSALWMQKHLMRRQDG